MSQEESNQPNLSASQPNPGNEFIWCGMVDDRNTHTLLYANDYRTLGDIAAKNVNELKDEGFEAHEIASLGRLLASRELEFTPMPAATPPNEPVEAVTVAQAAATEATAASSTPRQLQAA